MTFTDSNVYHVTVGADKSDKIVVQKWISRKATGAARQALREMLEKKELRVPRATFDVVIMNPPPAKKQRVTQMLERPTLAKVPGQIKKI